MRRRNMVKLMVTVKKNTGFIADAVTTEKKNSIYGDTLPSIDLLQCKQIKTCGTVRGKYNTIGAGSCSIAEGDKEHGSSHSSHDTPSSTGTSCCTFCTSKG
eukprot:6711290-Ditylum_brightwellii.AAC.1